MNWNRFRNHAAGALFGLSAGLWLLAGCADTSDPSTLDDALAEGHQLYEAHCMSCHGPNARGDGELADELEVSVPDLTTLTARNGGTYPLERVIRVIDGRTAVQAHGSRAMPVWWNVFAEEDGQPIPQEEVTRKINELAEYLRSIQQENSATAGS